LAGHTGGRLMFPMVEPEVRESFELVLAELDNQFRVDFDIAIADAVKLRKLSTRLRRDSDAAKSKMTVTSPRRIYFVSSLQ